MLVCNVESVALSFLLVSSCHRQCESLFSSKSGFHNYRGLLNNCIILLVRGMGVGILVTGYFFVPTSLTAALLHGRTLELHMYINGSIHLVEGAKSTCALGVLCDWVGEVTT